VLIVQSSSGIYRAVQYDGTNGTEIAQALRVTDYASSAGSISFKAFAMRTGGLLSSGHQFTVPLGHWLVWVNSDNPYVVVPPLTAAEFALRYQVVATAADIATLQAGLTAVNLDIAAIQAELAAFNADNITSGTLAFQRLAGTVPENQTVVLYNRPTLVDPGTAADAWRWLYNGERTVYGNEYNLLRVRGVPDFQVPARFMSNAARDGSPTLAIMQASLSDAASHLFQVMGDGDILGPGGASMIPTAPTAVTFNAVAGTANATLISDGSATGAPYPVTTVLEEANNRVYLDGAVTNPTGVSISGGTVLFTVINAHRPATWTQRIGRTSTGLQTRVTIKPNGECVLDQALAPAATLSFDGMSWRRA
jgi:hypothetical protein